MLFDKATGLELGLGSLLARQRQTSSAAVCAWPHATNSQKVRPRALEYNAIIIIIITFLNVHMSRHAAPFFFHDNSLPFSERKDLEAEMERAHGKPRGILLSSVPIITEQSHAAQRGSWICRYACMCAGCCPSAGSTHVGVHATPQPGKAENTWQSDETFAIPRMGMDVAWTGCVIHGWAWMDVDSSSTTRYMLLYVG
jgi:hypothetical protein